MGGRGRQLINEFRKVPGARIAALCDVDEVILDKEVRELKEKNQTVAAYSDLRRVFDDDQIDAVIIATPNHWHALATIWACQAGKDVYVEKPFAHNIWEGRQAVAAARKYGRVVQVGTQRRSSAVVQQALEYGHAGELGGLLRAWAIVYRAREGIGNISQATPVPSTVDYDLWCGPTEVQPLMRKQLHYEWHWFWSTGNGEVGNNGAHHIDISRWALRQENPPPRVVSIGGRFGFDDCGETANTQIAFFDYQPAPLICEIRNYRAKKGVESTGSFRGTKIGTVVEFEGGYLSLDGAIGKAFDAHGKKIKDFTNDQPTESEGVIHAANFLEAVRNKSSANLSAEAQVGQASATCCHMANVSHRLGKQLSPEVIADSLRSNRELADAFALGIRVEEASEYFATLPVQRDEWLSLMLLNTYCEFEHVLTPPAKHRMREIILSYANGLAQRNLSSITADNNENHLLNWKVIYLLSQQKFGVQDPSRCDEAKESIKRWVQYRINRGLEEFNSPHYVARSLHPLLLMFDFSDDAAIRQWAQMGIDSILGNYALLTLNNVRGGPYFRTIFTDSFPDIAPRDENRNGFDDHLYETGYLLFGNCAPPRYRKNDYHFLVPCIATSSYRLPAALYELATNKQARGNYEVKARRRDRFGQIYNLYYTITPAYSLGALQDRVPLDNFHSGASRPVDHWNNQIWELTFADPLKILGPKRNLLSLNVERQNPNTANMQFKNVLFYKGEFLDYNSNLSDNGGSYSTEPAGDKALHFWSVSTADAGRVYVGIIDYARAGGGILEVGLEADYPSFTAFQELLRRADSQCSQTGLVTRYVSTKGDAIEYDHGNATVNGKPFALKDYATYEGPLAKSGWAEGVMEFSINSQSLRLDARDLEHPRRTVSN